MSGGDRCDAVPDTTLSVMEETATIGIREVVTGRVRVSTSTETFEQRHILELHGTRVEVTRVPMDRMLELQARRRPAPAPRAA